MGRNVLTRIAAGMLLMTCWATGWSRGDDSLAGSQGAAQKAAALPQNQARATENGENPGLTEEGGNGSTPNSKFEDTAVATLNHKVDAAAQTSPAVESSPPAAASAPTNAQAEVAETAETSDLPPAAAADRTSRLAALKARLHQHMGTDADPPAEEPARHRLRRTDDRAAPATMSAEHGHFRERLASTGNYPQRRWSR